jgi:DNA-binding transcriptional ArsR family regulator
MADDPEEPWEEKLRKKMEELDAKMREVDELEESLRKDAEEIRERKVMGTAGKVIHARVPGVRISVSQDGIEAGAEAATDLAKMIKDSIRKSFAEIGEDALSDIIDEMSEDMASIAMKSVSIPDRIKILKLLYYGPKSYGEISKAFPDDYAKSSLQHHLQKLRNVKLINRDEVSGNYDITSRGRSLLRLMAVFYGAMRGGELDES